MKIANNTFIPETLQLERLLKTKPEQFWLDRGEKMALQLFHEMSRRVPAYKEFLREHQFDPSKVKTVSDFKHIPLVDKDNYLRKFKRADLCWDGDFKQQSWVISTTSGSTGEPYYFPRQNLQDAQYARTAELYLRANFQIDKKSTLYIDAFPMGAWIGGVFTYEAVKQVAENGAYSLSIITPGINTLEVLKAVKNLGGDFDQILIGAYGPFLKDIVDQAAAEGVQWSDYDMGFILSAEAFSETFRDYLIEKASLKNIFTATLNHYGTVDLGTMSHETPLSILLRREALKNERLYKELFSRATSLPTHTQFLPELFYFEDIDGSLVCSANSGIPLVRYDLKDRGNVMTKEKTFALARECGLDITKLTKEAGLTDTIWNLPFVHVYERSDFSVSFYAFQIYPNTVRKALLDRSVQNKLTGKFTMRVDFDKNARQCFEINTELKPHQKEDKTLKENTEQLIIKHLLQENSEYRKVYEEYGATQVKPRIKFWPYGEPTYFLTGTKQKWVKK